MQPQQQIQEAVEPGATAGLAPRQPLQRAQPPLHGCGRSPAPGLEPGRSHASPSARPSVGPRVVRESSPHPSRPPRCHLPPLPPARPHLGAAPRPLPRPSTDKQVSSGQWDTRLKVKVGGRRRPGAGPTLGQEVGGRAPKSKLLAGLDRGFFPYGPGRLPTSLCGPSPSPTGPFAGP